MRNLILPALVLALAGLPAATLAGEASPWSAVDGAAMRLLPGNAPGNGPAGLEIKLDEGWKTYWRNPGDAGIPPSFDWSKSENLSSVTVLWPAPTRLDDEGGSSAVYRGDVVLPLKVTAADPAKPVRLSLALDYAICHEICVPAKGSADLTLAPGTQGGEGADAIAEAVKHVPKLAAIGAQESPAISKVTLDTSTKPATLTIDVKAASAASLFVEAPLKWYLPMPNLAPGADKANPKQFVLQLDGLPKDATLSGNELRFTLSTGEGSVESLYRLP
ncbi:protein involved in C cytochrome biogenesis [Labrys miyagiensis]|uniref:Protein involved in C cytochrome biogenesis n=1 Tax=Labrys miyagiensis TaxID=346912 RepID=A0ABQ6CSB9_9HYPH|nr:protein-disulfide reductase DsbD domain-containing protein [Labrys miyagiensis]GLS22492.1 protein involved in C cytochrome biogenesis [Labrys miyagiensis]